MSDVNFKKLNELEVIEEAGESTYAVVEENGVPKRIPGKKIGGGLPEGGAPYQQLVTDGEGVARWEDRTHYSEIEKTVLNFSVSADGFVVDSGENSVVHEFSELVNNGYLRVCDPISHDAYKSMVIVTDNHTLVVADYWDVVTSNGMVNDTFAAFEGFVITYVDNANVNGDVFSTAGLYMYMPAILGEENPDARATASWQTEIIKTLDPKYLPEGVGGGGKFVVTFATEDNSTFTADKTYAEIDDAYNAGQEMLCAKASNGNTLFGSLAAVMPGMGYGFTVINATPIGISHMIYLVSPDNSVIMQEITGAVEGK